MLSDLPNGFEAHKLINISLGKIAASRSGRTGASLHKSLLVASVLHKARFVYLEEAHNYNYHHTIFCPPQGQPEEFAPEPPRAPTPLPEVTVTPVEQTDRVALNEECKARLEDSDDSSDYVHPSRKRRRVSDQETEAAVSSILPKRLKSEVDSEQQQQQCSDCYFKDRGGDDKAMCSCGFEVAACRCSERSAEDDVCSMEVDHITSLVSIFSFNHQQQQQQSADLCSTQAHQQADAVGPPVLALTA